MSLSSHNRTLTATLAGTCMQQPRVCVVGRIVRVDVGSR